MIAKRIAVTSRRWNAGHDQEHTLTFREGLRLRPLISKARVATLNQFSTRVSIKIDSKDAEALHAIFNFEHSKLTISLKELVGHLCPSLDCDIFVSESSGALELAHSRNWFQHDASRWVRDIIFADARVDPKLDEYVITLAPLVRKIEGPDGAQCGRAAIAIGGLNAGVDSVGGLVASSHSRSVTSFSRNYVGTLDFEPDGVRRSAGLSVATKTKIAAWASEQAALISQLEIHELEYYLAAANVAFFGGDASPIARILVNRETLKLDAVFQILEQGTVIYAALDPQFRGESEGLRISNVYYRPHPSHGIGLSRNEIEFFNTTMESWSGSVHTDSIYHQVPTEKYSASSSFLSLLKRYAEFRNRVMRLELLSDFVFGKYVGKESPREGLVQGSELRGPACKLWLE